MEWRVNQCINVLAWVVIVLIAKRLFFVMNITITIFLFGLFADFLLAQSIMSLRDCMEYAL